MAAKKKLPLWRWLLIVVPHLHLLDGEANNTAHEESIRSHRARTWHFRNAMDSASFSVMLRAIGTTICASYAVFGRDPWGNKSLEDTLNSLVEERHRLNAKLEKVATQAERTLIRSRLLRISKVEAVLRRAQAIQKIEENESE